MNTCIFLIFSLSIKLVCLQTCSNFDRGVDRSGPWYAYIRSIITVEECCALCGTEGTRCQSWIFVSLGATVAPGCYLKQNIPTINETSTCGQYCTSGFKGASLVLSGRCVNPGGIFELAVDRPGSSYARLTSIQTHPACCAMCQMEGDKCRAWTFVRSGALNRESGCFLKTSVPSISNTPCVPCTSGTK